MLNQVQIKVNPAMQYTYQSEKRIIFADILQNEETEQEMKLLSQCKTGMKTQITTKEPELNDSHPNKNCH